jgi:NADH pyrophosphatase NudC (nudix superfamily)
MKIDFKGIVEGITNAIFVKKEVENIANQRIAICKECEHYSLNLVKRGNTVFDRKDAFCTDCGCNMYLKTRALSAMCPLGSPDSHFPQEQPKWLAVTNDAALSDKILETEELNKDIVDYKVKLSQNKIDDYGNS